MLFNLKPNHTLRLLQIFCFILVAFLVAWNLYHLSPKSHTRLKLQPPYRSGYDEEAGEDNVEKEKIKLGEIDWYPCIPAVRNVDCGSISVPKDYSNLDSTGQASIALAIYRATKSPRKGSVFLNPGGPGGPGTHLTLNTGRSFAKLIGEDWDLVGFDPRGVGRTRPETHCFSSNIEYDTYFANTVVEQGITFSSLANLPNSSLAKSNSNQDESQIYTEFLPQYRQLLALKKGQAELCRLNMLGAEGVNELKYMGTTTVVKDIDYISRVLDGGEAKINYWGESYGSIIGAYLVNMLPERVGSVVVDGIVDPIRWSNEPSHKWATTWLSNVEKAYEIFMRDCSKAGPSICPVTKYQNEPWQNIEQRFEEFFDGVARKPIPIIGRGRPGVLTSGAARGLLATILYNPHRWIEAAHIYAAAFEGNATELYTLLVPPLSSSSSSSASDNEPRRDLYRQAITCIDSPSFEAEHNISHPDSDSPTPESLAHLGVKNLLTVSPHFGVSLLVGEADIGCEFWPVRVGDEERFSGPWGLGRGYKAGGGSESMRGELERKMLIISNTADPVTPLLSGLKLNSLLPDSSVMIIQDGPGHCSNGLPSLCTANLVQAYFNGSRSSNPNLSQRLDPDPDRGVPQNGTLCIPDVSTFPQPGDEADRKWSMMREEDRELLRALRNIRRGWEEGGD